MGINDELSKVSIGLRFSNGREVHFKIIGMHCATCSLTVQKALLSVNGVLSASVSLANDEAVVIVDPAVFDYAKALKAVQGVGYDIYRETLTFMLKGLEPEEVNTIVRALHAPGVFSVVPNPVNHTVTITYNPLEIDEGGLRAIIENAGFKVIGVSKGGTEDFDVDRKAVETDLKDIKAKLTVAIPLTALIFLLEALSIVGIIPGALYAIASFALSTPVQFYSGMRFIRGAVRAFRNVTANMDTLVTLGTLSAYVFSVLVLTHVIGGDVFFDSSAAIITFILIGRYLETRLKLRVGSTMRELARLYPRSARVVRSGVETLVSINEVKPGDIVVIKEGEVIPVDGYVDGGEGYVDESVMTGEPRPRHKGIGDLVLAGTILARGYLRIKVTRSGEYAFIAQVIKQARQAQSLRLPIQSLVDRIASYFTWFVISAGVLTFMAWYLIGAPIYMAVLHMASVLVIACPCALGLATPISVVAGTNNALKHGILIRESRAIELSPGIKVVAFDKTGTLTRGRFEVISVFGDEKTLYYAAIAEGGSEHPIAKAILERAREVYGEVPSAESYDSVPGMGVITQWNGLTIGVGNEKLIKGFEARINPEIENKANDSVGEGFTVVYVIVNNEVSGAIALGDSPRPEAPMVISELRRMNIIPMMLTGDNTEAAKVVAKKLGIDYVYSGLMPDEKAEVIKELRDKFGITVMVGDGVNDAVALKAADIGIAMGAGTDIAKSVGDVVLLDSDLTKILSFIKLSRKILSNIRFNILYAFMYNVVLIPIAAGAMPGLTVRPEWAGLAMALSSITVTLNALRLRYSHV
ncbi:heavy metal translocating P-type ATPase [Vulcanisaeta souniana]|uniref:Copper-translocating P-type ATPase n=1 Tax=Vulcanisaeta souniana JCM 11219 TaxID=1293586 RepID=A0A830EMF3_9CREN|nr:copper-translocating P-type ATPase [Vulcanisaeta souniana]GGI85233.1 copper-translocating P-type ATPase [Vulcanisaeta souniana JCM 11219]